MLTVRLLKHYRHRHKRCSRLSPVSRCLNHHYLDYFFNKYSKLQKQLPSVVNTVMYRERKCADTIGTVPVPWAGHFQC